MVLVKRNLLITGRPGVGKTTLVRKLSELLKNLHPVGFFTEEIREEGVRKGFELISLNGTRGILSHKNIRSPLRVGEYKVNIESFEDFLGSISFFNTLSHLIIVDEIGKMECFSDQFKKLLKDVLDSEKWVIGTIASKGNGFIAEIKGRKDVKIFEITEKNRDFLFLEILEEMGIDH